MLIRYLLLFLFGFGAGHVQSLVVGTLLMLLGCNAMLSGLLADLISSNRKLLEDVQYRVRKMDYDAKERKTTATQENAQERAAQ